MPEAPELHLDLLTAGPILRFLVARRGFEAHDLPVREGWEAAKELAVLPTSFRDGGTTFQAYPSEAAAETLEVFMGRKLSEPPRPDGALTRLVGIHFVLTNESGLRGQELWSAQFENLSEFCRQVERSPVFDAATNAPPGIATFWVEEQIDRALS